MDNIFETKKVKEEENYAKFEITPLAHGYGQTLGNSLRRVLLSSLPGAAITEAKVAGVKHKFSTLKGMKEDVLEFLLNLKQVKVKYSGDKPAKISLSAKSEGQVKASDLVLPGDVSIVNPDLVLANLSKGAKLEAQMVVESGIGYSSSEERATEKVGVVPLDAVYSPILKVNYKVDETRVGRKTNFDKLTLEIWTDGTLKPEEALKEASSILVSYLSQIISPKEVVSQVESPKETKSLGTVGKLSVEEIGLPTRVANALIKAGYETVEKLSKATDNDLKGVRNLGEKSVGTVKKALKEKGVAL